MKRLLISGAVALAWIVAGNCAAPAAAAEGEDTVARGRAIIETNCARCHAIGMDDTSHHEEAPPFRVVVTRYPPESLAEALAEGIVSGHPDMPEFVFQPDEIDAILAYLGTLAPASQPAPAGQAGPESETSPESKAAPEKN
jgi:cytochrome c